MLVKTQPLMGFSVGGFDKAEKYHENFFFNDIILLFLLMNFMLIIQVTIICNYRC